MFQYYITRHHNSPSRWTDGYFIHIQLSKFAGENWNHMGTVLCTLQSSLTFSVGIQWGQRHVEKKANIFGFKYNPLDVLGLFCMLHHEHGIKGAHASDSGIHLSRKGEALCLHQLCWFYDTGASACFHARTPLPFQYRVRRGSLTPTF